MARLTFVLGILLFQRCSAISLGLQSRTADPNPAEEATSSSEPEDIDAMNCLDEVKKGDQCFTAVKLYQFMLIHKHPDWYENFTAQSSFKDIQTILAKRGKAGCRMPCPEPRQHTMNKADGDARDHRPLSDTESSEVAELREEVDLLRAEIEGLMDSMKEDDSNESSFNQSVASPANAHKGVSDKEFLPNVDEQGQVIDTSADQIKNFDETFKALDKNGDGLLSAAEMKDGLSRAGLKEISPDLAQTFKAHANDLGDKDETSAVKEALAEEATATGAPQRAKDDPEHPPTNEDAPSEATRKEESTTADAAPEVAKEASSTWAPETDAEMHPRIRAEIEAQMGDQMRKQLPEAKGRAEAEASSTPAPDAPEAKTKAKIVADVESRVRDELRKEGHTTPEPLTRHPRMQDAMLPGETPEMMQARIRAHLEAEIQDQLLKEASSTPAPETPQEMRARIRAELEAQMRDQLQMVSSTLAPETEEHMKARIRAELEAQMRGQMLKRTSSSPAP